MFDAMAAAITPKLTSRLEGKTVDVQRPSISNSSVSSQIPSLSPSGGDTTLHNHNAPGSAFLDSFLGVTHTSFPLPPSPVPITVSEAKISVEFLQPTPKGRVHVVASPREQEDPTPTSSAPPFYGLHASCSLFWAYRSLRPVFPLRRDGANASVSSWSSVSKHPVSQTK